jgi:hypothetical protein
MKNPGALQLFFGYLFANRFDTIYTFSSVNRCCLGYYNELTKDELNLAKKLHIAFSALHWIRRLSRTMHQHQISIEKHECGRQGLLTLM